MRALQSHHIVDLYVWVATLCPDDPKPSGGRPLCILDSELLTLMVWNSLTNTCSHTLKQLYDWICMYHARDVRQLPKYNAFVAQCHRILPKLIAVVSLTMESDTPLRFADSTMLPVCRNHRAKRHKVAAGVAAWGKNHQGSFFGFKLHAAIDHLDRLVAIVFTPADRYDGQLLEQLVNEATKVAVGDSHYGASTTRKKVWRKYQTIVVAPPHYKQMKQVMASWQQFLLSLRAKVECTFDTLKQHLGLVSSFPRSVKGYFLHYLRVILGYQMRVGF